MNIMEIISGVGVNGAVVHSLLLTRELAARGNEVMLVCRHDAWVGRQLAGQERVTVVESDMSRWPFTELRRIASLAATKRIDVINTHMSRAHNFGIWLRRFSGIPCVTTAHSHKVNPHWWLADHIIAVSDFTRRYHRTHNLVADRRIDTVHGFVDLDRFSGVPASARAEVRSELGVDESTLLIGCIGDFLPRKGQLYLVRALPRILSQVPQARLAFAGSVRTESYLRRVRAEVGRLGMNDHILWLGYRQDVPQLLSALDVYVLASLDEMFPVAVLEAMAAGRPIVATAVGGTPECVPDPDAAVLVPPADPAALADAILGLLCDAERRRQVGERARQTVQNHFTVQTQAPKIEAIFAKVAKRS